MLYTYNVQCVHIMYMLCTSMARSVSLRENRSEFAMKRRSTTQRTHFLTYPHLENADHPENHHPHRRRCKAV